LITDKSKIKRVPNRAIYNKDEIYKILDREYLCHVGIIHNNHPVVIPTLYGRKDDSIYIHGASVSRLITQLEKGIEVSISVANINGIVLARSAFHHSINYESVVIFGTGKLVPEDQKEEALKIISDHIIDGRWEECRAPNLKELKATKVIKIDIDEISAKVRAGGPIDDKNDYELDYWAGVIPIKNIVTEARPDEKLKPGINVPEHVKNYIVK